MAEMIEFESVPIRNPAELTAFAVRLQKLDLSTTHRYHLVLALLQPLADPAVVATCRDPSTSFLLDEKGNRIRPINHETLDGNAFGRPWREAWKGFVPSIKHVESITFDITLPQCEGRDNSMIWYRFMIDDEGIQIGFLPEAAHRLVILLATEMKMLAHGARLPHFEVASADRDDSKQSKDFEKLRQGLKWLDGRTFD